MARFKSRIVEVDAVKVIDFDAVNEWLDSLGYEEDDEPSLTVDRNPTGDLLIVLGYSLYASGEEAQEVVACLGDWILRHGDGTFEGLDNTTFHARYQLGGGKENQKAIALLDEWLARPVEEDDGSLAQLRQSIEENKL
jgi:hypothetical protein